MAEDDIYGSKRKYKRFVENIDSLIIEPSKRNKQSKRTGKYYCKNPANLKYFRKLDAHFRAVDLSFIRRIRIFNTLLFVSHCTNKDFVECGREDMNFVMERLHKVNKTVHSKKTVIKQIKTLWKVLFPELDSKNRPDETITPYVVRHLSASVDISKSVVKDDLLTEEEYLELVNYFGHDSRLQAFCTIASEGRARPQALLYLKIGDMILFDNYAEGEIKGHGKEGPRLLPPLIESYPYLIKWLEQHPLRHDKNAFLFVNTGNVHTLQQLKIHTINKALRKACKELGIDKPISSYSFKRSRINDAILKNENPLITMYKSGWTRIERINSYNKTKPRAIFDQELIEKGLIEGEKKDSEIIKSKKCFFCNASAGFSEIICPQCKRPLDRTKIKEEAEQKNKEIIALRQEIKAMKNQFEGAKTEMVQELMKEILKIKDIQTSDSIENTSGNAHQANPQKTALASFP